jgi:subtilisin family serine protease
MTATPDQSYPSAAEARQALQTATGKGIKVAILDSGVEASHPGLGGMKLVDDLRFELRGAAIHCLPNNGMDVFGHGTAVAGLIRGVAPEARIGSFGVLNGVLRGKSAVIAAGAAEAVRRGYHILNCSFGNGERDEIYAYKQWVDEAFLAGCHVVTACSNQYFEKPEWPAYLSHAIATNFARGQKAGEFFYRPGKMVSLAAPALNLEVLWNRGTRKINMGSSFAAPQVAGYLARLLSVFPLLSPLLAKDLVQRLANPWRTDLAAPNEYDWPEIMKAFNNQPSG